MSPTRVRALLISAAFLLAVAAWGMLAARLVAPAIGAIGGGATLAEGVAALDHNDYGMARRIFAGLAQGGNAEAEIWLGRMAEQGLGAPANGSDAIARYSKAAQAGSAEAERRLGELYLQGDLVLQDAGQARHWLAQAAKHADAPAARDLGSLYAAGLGLPKDPQQAYAWLSIAASKGDRVAAAQRDRLLAGFSTADATQAQVLAQETLNAIAAPQAATPVATAAPLPATPAS